MSTVARSQCFYDLLLTLNNLPLSKRTRFLEETSVDRIADLLVEDTPKHFTLLNRIVELLTLIPMEERCIVEEITTVANSKHSRQLYNQSSLFSSQNNAALDILEEDDSEFNYSLS